MKCYRSLGRERKHYEDDKHNVALSWTREGNERTQMLKTTDSMDTKWKREELRKLYEGGEEITKDELRGL